MRVFIDRYLFVVRHRKFFYRGRCVLEKTHAQVACLPLFFSDYCVQCNCVTVTLVPYSLMNEYSLSMQQRGINASLIAEYTSTRNCGHAENTLRLLHSRYHYGPHWLFHKTLLDHWQQHTIPARAELGQYYPFFRVI